MSLLEAHKKRLEKEITDAKRKIAALKESEYPDLAALNQLNDQVQRSCQLIEMINGHTQGAARQTGQQS